MTMKTIVLSFIRHIVTALGGGLAAKGFASAGDVEQLAGGIVFLVGFGWSVWEKLQAKKSSAVATMQGPAIKLFAVGLFASTWLLAGCGSLDPSGAYGGDKLLYTADRTIVESYDLFHTFVLWEYDYRSELSRWPEIKQAADHVRANAQDWIRTATAMRDAYAAAPSGANGKALSASLATLKAAMAEATRYLARRDAAQAIP